MPHSLRDTYLDTLTVHEQTYHYYSISRAEKTLGPLKTLPKSLVVLLKPAAPSG